MSDASKQRSWTKPAAMAIPKGGFFKDKVEQGQIRPDLSQNSGVLRLLHPCEDHPRKGRALLRVCKEHREGRRCPARLSRRAQAALSQVDALPDQRGDLFHVSGHLRYGLRQIHRGCRGSFRVNRAQDRFRKPGGLSGGLEDERLRHSSSSSVSIIARASWNTANIRT